MILALHGETITNCNLLTHIDVTRDTGYDAVEIAHCHIERYLKQGLTVERRDSWPTWTVFGSSPWLRARYRASGTGGVHRFDGRM